MTISFRDKHSYVAALLASCAGLVFLASDRPQARAQEPKVAITPRAESGSADRRSANLRVDSDLVLVQVLVTDSADRAVLGLNKDYFKLFEDKIEQAITHFASEDVPVSIGIVFDRSGSMRSKLQQSRAAIAEFLQTANPDDEFFLVEFSDTAQVVVDMTRQGTEIQNRLVFTQPKGSTALLDAVYLALAQMRHAHNSRKALLVISDGGDNSSRYTMREIKSRVRESDVQIYSIGIFESYSFAGPGLSPEELAGPGLLSDIAQEGGGRFFKVANPNDLPAIASKIGFALRNQYVIGYSPAVPIRDGKYHRISVKLVRPKGLPALRAFFRPGYFSPAQ